MVRDIRLLDRSLGTEDLYIEPGVEAARIKLERSIASITPLKAGHVVKESDLHLLSPGDGFKWRDKAEVIGKTLRSDLPADEIIYPEHLS